MNPVLSSLQSMREMLVGKTQDFIDEIQNVHIVWLEEIQQEANRMFSRYPEPKQKGLLKVLFGLTGSKFYSPIFPPSEILILNLS